MRVLEPKKRPKVNFYYSSSPSPPKNQQQYSPFKIQTLQKISPISFQPSIKKTDVQKPSSMAYNDSSHIKIIDFAQSERKLRRHRIFEEVGMIKKASKSKDKSLLIYPEVRNEQEKMKELISSKEFTAEKQVQTIEKVHVNQPQNIKIGTFGDGVERSVQADLSMEKQNRKSRSPQIKSEHQSPSKSMNKSILSQELHEKQKQLFFLKLEVERYQRCQKITRQNQRIYKRLITKLNNSTNSLETHQRLSSRNQQYQIQQKLQLPYNQQKKYKRQLQVNDLSERTKLLPLETDQNHYKQTERDKADNYVVEQSFNNKSQKQLNIFKMGSNLTFHKHRCRAVHSGHITERQSFRKLDSAKKGFDQTPLNERLSKMNRKLQSQCIDYAQSRYYQRSSLNNSQVSFVEQRRRISSIVNPKKSNYFEFVY